MNAIKILPYTSECGTCGFEVYASNRLTRLLKKLWHDVTRHPKDYRRWLSKKRKGAI